MLALVFGCAASSPPPGPEEWVEEVLEGVGGCVEDSDCVIYTHDCMPFAVAEADDGCSITVPEAFDTRELDEVMARIAVEGLGRNPDGSCGMCMLALPFDPICVESRCQFP